MPDWAQGPGSQGMGNIAGSNGQWLWGQDPRAEFPAAPDIINALRGMTPGNSLRVGGLNVVRDPSGKFLLDDETLYLLNQAGVKLSGRAAGGYATEQGMVNPILKWGQLPLPRERTKTAVSPFRFDQGINDEMKKALADYAEGFEPGGQSFVVGDLTAVRGADGRYLVDDNTLATLKAAGIRVPDPLRKSGYKRTSDLLNLAQKVTRPQATIIDLSNGFPTTDALTSAFEALTPGQRAEVGDALIERTDRGWEFSHPQFTGKLGRQANVWNTPRDAATYLDVLARQDGPRYFPQVFSAPAAAADVPVAVPPAGQADAYDGHVRTDLLGNALDDQLHLFPEKSAAVATEGSVLDRLLAGAQAGYLDAMRDNPHDLSELFLGPLGGLQTRWANERVAGLGTAGRIGGAIGNTVGHLLGLWPLRIMWRAHPYDMASSMGPAMAANANGVAKGYSGWNQKEISAATEAANNHEKLMRSFEGGASASRSKEIFDPELGNLASLPYHQLDDLHLLKIDPNGHLPRRIAGPLGAGIAFATAAASSNMDVSNLFNLSEGPRAKGYKAALASQDDPTKTMFYPWAVVEGLIAGGSNRVLDWNRFHQERPEVSRQAYDAYDRYNKGMEAQEGDPASFSLLGGLVKGTSSNLEGSPELRIMGGRVTPLGIAAGGAAGLVATAAIKDYLMRAYDQAGKTSDDSLSRFVASDIDRRSGSLYNSDLSAYDRAIANATEKEHWYKLPYLQAEKTAVSTWQGAPIESYTPEQKQSFMRQMDEIRRQASLFGGSVGADEGGKARIYPSALYEQSMGGLRDELRQNISSRLASEGFALDQNRLDEVMRGYSNTPEGKALRRMRQIDAYYNIEPDAAARYFPERPTAESMQSAAEKVGNWLYKNIKRIA